MSDDIVAEIKKDYLVQLAKEGKRHDGRAFDEFRSVNIRTRYIQQAEGSDRPVNRLVGRQRPLPVPLEGKQSLGETLRAPLVDEAAAVLLQALAVL